MIKMRTAFTEEIDDVDIAVSDILSQLDLNSPLPRNVIGIVHCYNEFLESGVLSRLSQALPFELVGCTTTSESVPGLISQLALTLTVLASDDVRFVTGVSEPITDDASGPVKELYDRLFAGLPEKPALLIPFVPFLFNVGGDEFVEALDQASGGLPAFGTLAISGETDLSGIYTLSGGEGYPASLVLLALLGDVKPAFFSASVTEENILKSKAVVTGVERNLLRTINNIPAVDYFKSIGILSDNQMAGLHTMPVVVYLEDGSRLIRAIINAAEDGSAILCGAVPLNTTIALSTIGAENVMSSTDEVVRAAVAEGDKGILIYSCVARSWALGMKWQVEHETARARIGDSAPYALSYSGGEIFPEHLADGRIVNHLQNDSIIICVL
ncbi:MAG: FIST C-terminal domain-containing protein [Peptococcaceae bacterium]|jgi:hypothetical protein|nr:FIST C-terminal domain-containing protein [Peptococcaceae bacterium]